MAKLNGVKTLDMVNGEITKVVYNGEEYAKVADRAEKGDLLLSEFDHFDIDEGAFYVCDSVYRYGILLYDNNGDFRDRNHGEFKVFRKISASIPPTIEKRVDDLELRVSALEGDKAETIEFEGEKYRKVDREAREGDVVIITHNNGLLPSWYTLGRKYKVIEGGQIFDNDGDVRGVYSEDCGRTRETIDVYEPVLSAEEAKWAKIGRKVNEFKKGDVVQVEAKGKKRLYTVTQAVGNSVYFDCDLYGSKEKWNHAHDMTLVAPVESLFQH